MKKYRVGFLCTCQSSYPGFFGKEISRTQKIQINPSTLRSDQMSSYNINLMSHESNEKSGDMSPM